MNENYNNKYNMKTKEDVKFATVGKLLKELKKIKSFDEECMYYCPTVFVNNIDELYLGIVGMGTDEDGDLRIELEEMGTSEGFFDVTDCILRLEEFDKKTKVYLAGNGLYLNFDQDGSIFCEPDEDDETVGCYATIFGNYTPEPKPEPEPLNYGRRKDASKKIRLEFETVLALVVCIGLVMGIIYYIYAIITGVDGPLWQNILLLIALVFGLILIFFTFFKSKG